MRQDHDELEGYVARSSSSSSLRIGGAYLSPLGNDSIRFSLFLLEPEFNISNLIEILQIIQNTIIFEHLVKMYKSENNKMIQNDENSVQVKVFKILSLSDKHQYSQNIEQNIEYSIIPNIELLLKISIFHY